MCSYCLPNPRSFCKIHCSLSCAVLPCALVKYLVNRMACNESTVWFCVQHWLWLNSQNNTNAARGNTNNITGGLVTARNKIADTDISKILKYCFCFIIKNIMYSMLTFSKSGFMSWKISNCSNFNILLWFLIILINDDAFISAPMADTYFMVHLVCLFMKMHLLALLQDTCLDLVHSATLRKLSGCVRNITAFCFVNTIWDW